MATTNEPRNYPLSEMRVERGEVLQSLELALTQEDRREGDRTPTASASDPRRPQQWLPPKWDLRPSDLSSVLPGPEQRIAASTIPDLTGPAVPTDPTLLDAASGAGSLHALRRDVDLAMIWAIAGEPGFGLLAVDVQRLPDIRSSFGVGVANSVLRTIVDAVPFVLRSKDRLYRTGADKLVLFLAETSGEKALIAGQRLEEHVHASLAARRLPEVCLAMRPLDPDLVRAPVERVKAPAWELDAARLAG
jgi:GGDEF domain-containing protein